MKYIKLIIIIALGLQFQVSNSQTKDKDSTNSKTVSLDEVVISVNKTKEKKKNVAQQIDVITTANIATLQSQSTADLIANNGNVFVQKSQMGGGSINIRGFEANRVLLVIDGVRMNNLIYRAGHLQNIVTTDNNSLERVEILFGPASTIYGSDALGGVIQLFTKSPAWATQGQNTNVKTAIFGRYGSVNNERTTHFEFNYGLKKLASLTTFNYSNFGDLKGGKQQNPFYKSSYGERPFYVEHINGTDVLTTNKDPYLQVQSGYSQYDILQKLAWKPEANKTHTLNFQYSNSSDIPRYDRLTTPSGSGLKYAQWYYGPQTRLLTAYDLVIKNNSDQLSSTHFGINYQNILESRHNRKFDNSNLSHRKEQVNVFGTSVDFQKIIKNHNIRYGFDGQFNTLKSTANSENINTGVITPLDTRYPDGDNYMLNAALYISHTWKLKNQFVLVDGFRFGFASLKSTFLNHTFFNFPFTEVKQSNPVYSGSIGLIKNYTNNWKVSLLVSSGFRVPNIDDLSKVFESVPGSVIVPNPNLKPEKTLNTELGISKLFNDKTRWENSIYHTQIFNAIVTDNFTFNGQSSILYDGSLSQVLANQNKQKAFIYGFSSNIKSQLSENYLLSFVFNYTYGRIKTDTGNTPLDHIPPIMSRLSLNHTGQKLDYNFFINFNGMKKLSNYNLTGEDNPQNATAIGMPAWLTANLHLSYKVAKTLKLQMGVDNILDTQYRTFASGINAPGRNLFFTVRYNSK